MDELSAMLNQIMSDPESMRQIQAVAASLGLGDTQSAPAPPPVQQSTGGGADLSALASLLGGLGQQPQQPPPVQQNTGGGADLSALASLLGGLGQQPQPPPVQQSAMPDLSFLSGLLGGAKANNQQANAGNSNVSALAALLNGGNPPSQAPSGILPNLDLSTIMKLSQAFASIQSNKANIDLLLALKPRLNEERAKKVDDAIRVMQLIQFLPLIKESGLFGEMDNILGGLGGLVGGSGGGLGGLGGLLGNAGGGLGGLGSLLGNVGSGLGGIISGLGRR